MSKATEAPAGNITVAQLAASLSRKPSGSPQPPQTAVEPQPGTPPSEEEAPEQEPGEEPEDLSQAEPPAGEEPDQPTAEQPESAEAPEEPGEEEPEAQPDHGDMPAELVEAIEIAKTQGAKGVADLLKRVHKLTGERKAAQTAQQTAEAELERVRAEKSEPAPGATGEHPVIAQMGEEIRQCDAFIEWCEANPDGGELPTGKDGKTLQLDAAGVRKLLRNATDHRTEKIAERSQARQHVQADFQHKQQQAEALAVKEYPWLNNPKSEEMGLFNEMLKHAPQLKSFPDYKLVLGDYIRGHKARMAAAKARTAAPAKPRVEPTKVVTTPPATPPPPKPKGQKQVEEAAERLKKSGKTEDLAAFFAAQRAARKQTA